MTFTLERVAATPDAWRAAATAIYHAGLALVQAGQVAKGTVCEHEDDITAKQRGFLHAAVLPQIAEQVRVGEKGERFSVPIWKEYYRAKFLGFKWVMQKMPGQKKATPRKVRISTEDLGIKAYSEYIDRVIADAATEWFVQFRFLADEREAVRWKPAQRAKRREAESEPA